MKGVLKDRRSSMKRETRKQLQARGAATDVVDNQRGMRVVSTHLKTRVAIAKAERLNANEKFIRFEAMLVGGLRPLRGRIRRESRPSRFPGQPARPTENSTTGSCASAWSVGESRHGTPRYNIGLADASNCNE